jgi:hypothetical protein
MAPGHKHRFLLYPGCLSPVSSLLNHTFQLIYDQIKIPFSPFKAILYVRSPQSRVYMMHYLIPINTTYYCPLRSREIYVFYFIILPSLPTLPTIPTLPNLPTFKIVLWKILRFCTVLFPRILFPSMIQESSKKYETRGYGLPYKLRNPASDTVGTYYWRTINID